LGGQAKLRGRGHESPDGLEDRSGFRRRGDWRGGFAEAAELEKAEHEDGKAKNNSEKNYDAENRSDGLKAGNMPVGRSRAGRRKRCGDEVSKNKDRTNTWQAVPGLEQREQEANSEERSPICEKDARLAELEHAREESGG